MKLKIEKDIPIPEGRGKGVRAGPETLVLRKMEVGDSVFIPCKPTEYSRLRSKAGQVLGTGCYTVVSADDGVRIWKTGIKKVIPRN